MSKELNKDCPCTNDCARHGNCEECKANHANKEYPPACQRVKEGEKS